VSRQAPARQGDAEARPACLPSQGGAGQPQAYWRVWEIPIVLAGMLLSSEDLLSPQKLVPLAILVVVIFLLLRPRRIGGKGPSAAALRTPPAASTSQDRRDLEALIVELHELSRKINADIDTHFAKLEAGMRDADRRIATLTRLTRKTGQPSGPGVPAEPGATPPPEDNSDPNLRHAIVYELADSGLKPVDIARQLGKTPGEIELILNLRGKLATPADPPASDAQPPAQPQDPLPTPAANEAASASSPPRNRRKPNQSAS